MRTSRRFRDGASVHGVLLAGLAVLVGLAGCDRVPTVDRIEPPEPDLGFEQGPAFPGQSPIVRFAMPGSDGWVLLVDTGTGLAALSSGTDDIRSGDDDSDTPAIENLCPGETRTSSNPLPFQMVVTRSGVQHVLGGGDLFTWVYDFRGFPDVSCDFLTGGTGRMLAAGVVNSLQTSSRSPGEKSTFAATGTGLLDDLVHGGRVSTNIKLFLMTNAGGELVRADVTVDLSPDPRFR